MCSPSSEKVQTTVQDSYNQIASQYLAWTESKSSPRLRYIEKLLSNLPSSTDGDGSSRSILELGCGAGVPVTLYLAEKVGCIVANDISEEMLELARERVLTKPDGGGSGANVQFVQGSMLELEFGGERFDGVVAFFSLFHLTIAEQRIMLEMVKAWLKPDGVLVCNFGASSHSSSPDSENREGEKEHRQDTERGEWATFFGAPMFWANMGVEGSLDMMKRAGLEVVEWEILDATDDMKNSSEDDPDAGVKFVWAVAKRNIS